MFNATSTRPPERSPLAEPAITVDRMSKSFGDTQVLDEVSLTIDDSTVYGLPGANRAGKTTLVRILTTLLPAMTGVAAVGAFDASKDFNAVRIHIGLAGQFATVDVHLTGRENLEMVGQPADLLDIIHCLGLYRRASQ